jgi:hypothetical protein
MDLKEDRENLRQRLQKHQIEHSRPLTEREKFDRADMLDLYFSAYQFLSMQPHNNTQNLFDRYVTTDPEGTFTAEWDREGTIEEFEYWYSMIGMIYVEVTRSVAEFFEVALSGQLESMAEAIDPFIKDLPRVSERFCDTRRRATKRGALSSKSKCNNLELP